MNQSKIYQMDFFKTPEECEMESIHSSIDAIKKSSDKVRKGLYAKHGELFKMVTDIDERMKILERHICRSK